MFIVQFLLLTLTTEKLVQRTLKGTECVKESHILCLTHEWLFYNRYKYTYIYKLNTTSVKLDRVS